MSEQSVIERLKARLDELGESSFDVSVKIGKNRNFLNDLFVGRKKSFAASLLPDLALALNCDVQWLLGMQASPRVTGSELDTLPVMGTIEPGVWRPAGKDPAMGTRVPMRPDARYPASQQRVWMVRGDILDGEMIAAGTAVLTADVPNLAALFNQIGNGDLLVVERERGDLLERSLLTARREAAGVELHAPGEGAEKVIWNSPARAPMDGVRIAGLVLQIIRFRG